MTFRFEEPWLLLLLVLPLALLLWRPRRGGAEFGAFPLAAMVLRRSRGPFALRLLGALALACLAVAAARPQWGRTILEREREGRDLMLAIDLSFSMAVDDVRESEGGDRLGAVIAAAKRFVAGRPNDRIGLVFFASEALASCPPTFDHGTVTGFLDRTEQLQRERWTRTNAFGENDSLLGNGTNIGLGIGVALKWLRDERSRGRAVVLITDGKDSTNLPNWKDPVEAARMAARREVRVHCIGVGDPDGTMTYDRGFGRVTRGRVDPRLLPDPQRLQEIAQAGGGMAMTANDAEALQRVLGEVDRLEPTPRSMRTRDDYADRFLPWLVAGVALALLALVVEPRLRGAP